MEWEINSFRGILLQLEDVNIAVNGGGTLEDMERSYIIDGQAPYAMILTNEHHHRSHNVAEFCRKNNVPLITTAPCAQRLSLKDIKTFLLPVPGSRIIIEIGCGITFLPVKYDSLEPFCMTVIEGGTWLGIVPDGRILPNWAKYLIECDKVILGNRLLIPANTTATLKRRLKSVYNTQEELNGIFNNYQGKITYI